MHWRQLRLLVFFTVAAATAQSVAALELTPEERAFIAQHPVINVGGEIDWPPLDYVQDGEYMGAAKDYLDEIQARTGLKVNMVTGYTWSGLLARIRSREIDMLPMMYWSEPRGREFNLTNPFITVRHYAFVVGDPSKYSRLDDLHGKTVAIPKDYASADFITTNHPTIKILEVPTTLDAIDAVVTGRADAVIEQLAGIAYYARQQNISGLEPAFPIKFHVNNVHMAVRKDMPVLRGILQKALDDISPEQATAIMARWTGSEAAAKTFLPARLQLTSSERSLLDDKAELVACVNSTRMPYEGMRNGQMEGISADYLAQLSETLKIPVTQRVSPDWAHVLSDVAAGHCDVVPHALSTNLHLPLLTYFDVYGSERLALATKVSEEFFTDLADLDGQRIGIVDGYADLPALRNSFPDISLVRMASVADGLEAVAEGRLFGLLDYIPVLNYSIRGDYEGELKISGDYAEFSGGVRFAADSKQPRLADMVGRALDSISDAQAQSIKRKWVAVTIERRTDHTLLFRVLGLAAIILMFIAYRYLEMHRHREEIQNKNLELAKINGQLAQQKETAMQLAMHDPLTGLPNRAKLLQDLDHSIKLCERSGNKVALLFLDLDRFKYVNDSLGHNVGDKLLKVAARILSQQLRQTDTLFRLGGDEFVVILEVLADSHSPGIVAGRIADALRKPISVGEHTVNIGTSIGIAVCPDDSDEINTLLKYADSAMYAAKDGGGNGFRYYKRELSIQAQQRLVMESALQRATEQQHFSLVYQPIIDLRSGQVVKAEALLRWHDEILGNVPPDQFIPVAEENGLIVDIGQWVLRQACTDLKKFKTSGINLDAIAINVSSVELARGDITSRFKSIVKDQGVQASQIEIEITERYMLEKCTGSENVLERLRRLGHRISIDDFGTGYSSLSYLKQLPLNVIKIDRSFVQGLPHSQNDVAITQAIIALSHNLGYEVVAEGCETAEQLDFLTESGCDYVQGFYFSRPLAAQDLHSRVKSINARLKPPTVRVASIGHS